MVLRDDPPSAHLVGVIQSGDWDGLQIRWCLAAQRFDSSSPAFVKYVNCINAMLCVACVAVRLGLYAQGVLWVSALGLGFKARVRVGRLLGGEGGEWHCMINTYEGVYVVISK